MQERVGSIRSSGGRLGAEGLVHEQPRLELQHGRAVPGADRPHAPPVQLALEVDASVAMVVRKTRAVASSPAAPERPVRPW